MKFLSIHDKIKENTKNDYAFTQVMKNPKILKGFPGSILNISPEKIRKNRIKDRHLSKDFLEGKLSILDLYALVEDLGKINIEMQVLPFAYWDRRALSYLAKVYTQDLRSGQTYDHCVKAIHISILGFNQFPDTDYFYSSFHMREDNSDQWEIHVIELKKLNKSEVKDNHKTLYKWACLISADREEERMIIEKDPYIEEAVKELEKLERDPNRMDEYLFCQKNLSDYATQMKFSKELGKTEGRAEGEYMFASLMQRLFLDGRIEDARLAAGDENMRIKLYKEYHLIK